MKTRLTRACAIVGVIGLAPLAAAQAPDATKTHTPAIFATPTPTATPAPGEEVTNPAEAVKKPLEEGHEKSQETLKGAGGAVKEGAEKAAEGAKEAVENPAEAAKKAAEAATARSCPWSWSSSEIGLEVALRDADGDLVQADRLPPLGAASAEASRAPRARADRAGARRAGLASP